MATINGTSKKERINAQGTFYWDGHAWVLSSRKGATNGADTIDGKGGSDQIFGGGGGDTLLGNGGNDLLNGGGGRDFLTGGKGADRLIGGAAGDTFIYHSANESADRAGKFSGRSGDTISGFTSMAENVNVNQQDKIDLQPLVGNIGHALTWNGNLATNNGVWQTTTKNSTFVKVDTNGDGKADMVIKIASKESLDSGDFLGVSVDVDAPGIPTIDLKDSSDTGTLNNDDLTSDNTPTLTGTADPYSKVKIYDGATYLGSAIANAVGDWTYTSSKLLPGSHDFTATAEDGVGNVSDPTGILTVDIDSAYATPIVVSGTVTSSANDAEEANKNGRVVLTSTDLELSTDVDAAGSQLVGLRFHDLGIPVGAVITSAYIQFTVRERDFEGANLTIQAQNSANAGLFVKEYFNVSDRGTTASTVSWAPDAWDTVGASGDAQKTVDISALVQEVVNKTGWSPDNAIAFIFGGDGRRMAEAFDSDPTKAPVLHIEYQIGDVNTAPVGVDDNGNVTNEDTPLIIDVLANDTDADGNTLYVAAVAPGVHGNVTINIDGTVTYTPDADYNGPDSFKYTVSDGHGGLAYGTVDVSVTAVNDAPDAVDIAEKATAVDTPVTIDVLSTTLDVDGDALTVSITGAATHGSTKVNVDGTIEYTPDAAYTGFDTFTYQVDDGNGGTDTATATVNVGGASHGTITFAAFGDYGSDDYYETAVATMVNGFSPDFIVTLGDNYYYKAGTDYSDSVGAYYSDYINSGDFYASLSEHDYQDIGLAAYESYFTFPESSSHNNRYYDFVQGSVHFFVLNLDPREPDGIASDSIQALWLKDQLANSDTPWQVVIASEAPFSSGAEHGSQPKLQWDFEAWGADAVLSASDHTYERIVRDDNIDGTDMPYFVVGTGGSAPLYDFKDTLVDGSEFQYNEKNGALLVTASDTELTFDFYSITKFETEGVLEDTYTITAPAPIAPPAADEFLF